MKKRKDKKMHQKINKRLDKRKLELARDAEFLEKIDKELEGKSPDELREYVKNEAYNLSKLEAKPIPKR